MIKSSLIAALCLLGLTGFSQSYIAMVKSNDDSTWGYIDDKGNYLIKPQFYTCDEFSMDGWAAVKDDISYWFINKKGERLPTKLGVITSVAGTFHDGLIAVKTHGDWGYMNVRGELQIPAKYDAVTPFDEGFATAKRDKKYFVLNTAGEEIELNVPVIDNVRRFSEKLAPFVIENGNMGYINQQGKVSIPATFNGVGYFRDGLAWARDAAGAVGYINHQGDWAVKPQFDIAHDFDPISHMAQVKAADKWFYVDSSGRRLQVRAAAWKNFEGGVAAGRAIGEFWGFFDTAGEWVVQPKFDAIRDFKNGFAAVKLNGKWGFINLEGKWVISPIFAGAKDMERVE